MPTYDYKCNSCDHRFEQFQSMRDKVLKKCPSCGKNTLERLIGTGAAVIFKGSGFYQTDYRSESYKKAAAADSKPASGTEKSSDAGGSSSSSSSGADTKATTPTPAKPEKKTSKKSE